MEFQTIKFTASGAPKKRCLEAQVASKKANVRTVCAFVDY